MKKRKITRRTSSQTKRSKSPVGYTVISRRFVIGVVGLGVFLLLVVLNNKQQLHQAVAGISIARPLFAEATVTWPKVEGAVAYNIYYKEYESGYYTNAVRGVSPDLNYYVISYLTKGKAYNYKVAAVDGSGKEYAWTEEKNIENIRPM